MMRITATNRRMLFVVIAMLALTLFLSDTTWTGTAHRSSSSNLMAQTSVKSTKDEIKVLRGFWWDLVQAIERSSLPRKNSTRTRKLAKERNPRALATTLATREFMPSDAALVMRCFR